MTTTEFYNFAVLAATERGFENPTVTTHAMCMQGKMYYSIQIWLSNEHKHIDSKQHNNPIAAIQAFKDAIEYHKLTYSTVQEDIELNDSNKCEHEWRSFSTKDYRVCDKCLCTDENIKN